MLAERRDGSRDVAVRERLSRRGYFSVRVARLIRSEIWRANRISALPLILALLFRDTSCVSSLLQNQEDQEDETFQKRIRVTTESCASIEPAVMSPDSSTMPEKLSEILAVASANTQNIASNDKPNSSLSISPRPQVAHILTQLGSCSVHLPQLLSRGEGC